MAADVPLAEYLELPMSFTNGHALVIGVGTYAHDATLDVPITADDARMIWDVLTNPTACGYPDAQTRLLTDTDATRTGILDALDDLVKRADAEATVVVFFSGHGVVLADGTYALTTHDLKRGPDGKILADSVVTESELLAKLRAIRARKLLCLLNACHSGNVSVQTLAVSEPATLGAAIPPRLSAAILATGRGRVIITACRAEEYAYVGEGELTVFPKALVAALHGEGVSNRRGHIGVYDLYDRVYELVTAEVDAQQPELTVIQGVGPFPVALFQGADPASLGAFDAPAAPIHATAVRNVSNAESMKMLHEVLTKQPPMRSHTQNISGNARVGTAIAGDVQGNVNTTTIEGNQNNVSGGVQGSVLSGTFSGPVDLTNTGGGDNTKVGDISGNSGVAIGRGASSTVRHVNTGGGDYAEGDIDKRAGIFGGTFQGPAVGSVTGGSVNQGDSYSGHFQGAMLNIRSTLADVSQSIAALPGTNVQSKDELRQLIEQLNAVLQQTPSGQTAEAQAVAETAKQAFEQASKPQPNKMLIQICAEGLKQAAQHLAAALPAVLPIAQQITERIMALVR